VDGAGFKVWYAGLDDNYRYTIGYATAEICPVSTGPLTNTYYFPIIMKTCPPYYTDNFSDPGSGWPVYDDSDVRLGYASGQYQIWLKRSSIGWSVTPGAKATDFTATVSARRTSGTYGEYGIVFGLNQDWSQRYLFVIDDDSYSIWRYYGGWTPLRYWTSSGYINTGTSWNRLKVIRNGSSIAVYVNNHHLTTVYDSSLTGLRRIGLTARAPSDSARDIRFDNFSLYPASCGVEAAEAGFEMGKPEIHQGPEPPALDKAP
jgi:hypothetical protein